MPDFVKPSHEKRSSAATKHTPQPHTATDLTLTDNINSQLLTTGGILNLQRTIGNAALQRLMAQRSPAPIQREDTPTSAAPIQTQYELNNFVHNDAALTGDHNDRLKNIADQIKQALAANPGATITIVGHTDATGTDEINYKLGQTRANNVRDALVQAGVSNEQITAVLSQGKRSLKVQTDEKEGQNRRVEIRLNGVSNTAPAPTPAPAPGATDTPGNTTPTPTPGTTPPQGSKDAPKPEEEKKLKPTGELLIIPYKYEVEYSPDKDPKSKHKTVIEGELGIEYMLTKYDSGKLKLELPAELLLGMMGAYGYKDQKFELKGEVKLGVGIKVSEKPFSGTIGKNLYFKQALELSVKGDTSGAFSAGAEGKVGVGYKLSTHAKIEVVGKGELEYNSKENKAEGKASVGPNLVIEFW